MNQLPLKHIGVAVIWNDDRQILIDKRKAGGAMGGLWEFPGGKIEAGETTIDCILREIKEELDIDSNKTCPTPPLTRSIRSWFI
jgi:mutator protein MutT